MKKNSRFLRIIAVVMLSLLIVLPLASCGKSETVAADASGTSHGISWEYKQHNQTLTIRKTGENNPDFENASAVAWASVASSVKAVYVEDKVTGIGDYWFYGMDKLASVRLPGSITYIGKSAFAFCSVLDKIGDGKLPEAVTTIRARAFEASGLTSIDIPAATAKIGDYAFVYCNKLTNVVVRNANINKFNTTVFSYCSALSEVNTAAATEVEDITVTTKNGAFTVKPSTIYSDKIDGTEWEFKVSTVDGKKVGVLRITDRGSMDIVYEGEAWKDVDAVKEADSVTVIISSGITKISESAFEGMTNITEVVLEKEGDRREAVIIDEAAFKGCTGLKKFNIDKSVSGIMENAFEGSGLESLDISSTVNGIGASAFADCTALKAVVIRSDLSMQNEKIVITDCFEGCNIGEFYAVDEGVFETLKSTYGDKVKKVDSNFKNYTTYQEPVDENATTESTAPAETAPAEDTAAAETKKGSKVALIIMGVLIVGIIVAIILFKRYDKKTSGNNTTVVKNKNGQNDKNAKNAKNTKNGKKGKK